MEFRSVCTQPLETTFAPIAFELGLFVQLEKLENYLEHSFILKKMKNRTYRNLRKEIFKENSKQKRKRKNKNLFKGTSRNI